MQYTKAIQEEGSTKHHRIHTVYDIITFARCRQHKIFLMAQFHYMCMVHDKKCLLLDIIVKLTFLDLVKRVRFKLASSQYDLNISEGALCSG